jgi:hypothetical protein
MSGERADEVGFTAEKEIIRLMANMIDKINTEMEDIFLSLTKLASSFGFLLDLTPAL